MALSNSKLSGDEQCVIFSSSCATCSTRASVDRVAIRWMPMDRCVYMNRERKGCHIHSELVRAFSLWYAPVPGCDKFRLVLPMFSCRYVDEIQKLSRPFKYATPFPRGLSRVDVAERLRRQTANLIPSGCAGSNPVINVCPLFFSFSRHQRRPFSFSYVAAGITSKRVACLTNTLLLSVWRARGVTPRRRGPSSAGAW